MLLCWWAAVSSNLPSERAPTSRHRTIVTVVAAAVTVVVITIIIVVFVVVVVTAAVTITLTSPLDPLVTISRTSSEAAMKAVMIRSLLLIGLIATSVSAFSPTFGTRSAGVSSRPVILSAVDPFEGVDSEQLLQAYGGGKLRKLKRKLERRSKLMAKAAEEEAAKEERRAAHAAATQANKEAREAKMGKSSGAGDALKIIIAGAPASGKGTQCAIIKEKYGVVHLSTGDMLRAAVAAGSEVGKQAKDFMDAGKLVPDEVIIGVVRARRSSCSLERLDSG